MKRSVTAFLHSILVLSLFTCRQQRAYKADIIIYGGTSAAVIAAVQAARMQHSVVIVCPDRHLGGLTSGGLGWTDGGNTVAIGGLAREFYERVYDHYQKADAWKWQKRDEFSNRGQGAKALNDDDRSAWTFEPHVAEAIFDDFIREYDIMVHRDEWLDRASGVKIVDGRISTIRVLSGAEFSGKMFIDATYEGDLLATAGVSYHVGREANSVYNETWNGVQTGILHHAHYFSAPVDPYIVPGDLSSGLLPRISADPPGEYGSGDARVQAYCYRLCLSNHPDNRVPFARPQGYDPWQYELLVRTFAAGWRDVFAKFDDIPNRKTDTNNHGPFSTDNIGMNYDYPEASYERRAEILHEHQLYQQGLLYFLAHDERVPADIRERMNEWGLAKDEFLDNDHWPQQIYVREARRMIGDNVMTEHDVLGRRQAPRPVGMGSYTLDSHNVQRYVTPDGAVQNEGDIGVKVAAPYRISYGSLVPKREECQNLLVPVCISCSHIAFGSIRMEPVFMILGQSAATAAALAIEDDCAVQDVAYDKLEKRLVADQQRLHPAE
ncbi:FAD-dependent oxidoreductase [candidate division KSB1 bacterium]|nr:FAD-dependent oxidoreductase [candidate division KSB1 bacterium]